MKMYLAGEWVDREQKIEVRHPFDGLLVDTVPQATRDDVERALAAAVEGARVMAKVTAYDRFLMLRRAADVVLSQKSELGRLISLEEGKTLAEGEFEVTRAATTLEVSAEEAKRLTGEMLPLDAAPGAAGKMGFTLRVPCGVVVAIAPFNFPLNLVCHKVGPALAAGNAVVLKPASNTPLSALKLIEILLAAGVPPLAVQCLTGAGGEIGTALCQDERVRKITFTGSVEVGKKICAVAGLKRVTMELGSNSPLIVLDDADLNKATDSILASGFGNAGQVCISAQRIIALPKVYDELLDRLQPKVEGLTAGDPMHASTRMGPMIRESDAVRVEQWVHEAVAQGARLLTGGSRRGTLHEPTLLADVQPNMRISRDELFGPAVGVTRAASVDDAIRLANDSRYGLSAGLFTQDLDAAMKFARHVECGNVHVNWGPAWRADLMPYGGLKESGLGKEGPKYAIQEMTETKTVVLHLPPD
ncbi:Succinate-semialdehyde dehydrogenase [NADP(+)] GabD [Anatilimnocola aggregata]|uniref:Succinate-semialdehyde dehydrogenase [NADP(+)] GabD n=1 Tax=Anatilimnocola aggregata TaxID=2528021 RepID=A0A517YL88_9BACT|nr:aldehyde dehydrogenase family protein [Anatilimnocola aggregata]QDU30983.1 Succinate-semialdehyde dehydrogenase [NADP(+)] GabD [Anatilimnocola aggregata]